MWPSPHTTANQSREGSPKPELDKTPKDILHSKQNEGSVCQVNKIYLLTELLPFHLFKGWCEGYYYLVSLMYIHYKLWTSLIASVWRASSSHEPSMRSIRWHRISFMKISDKSRSEGNVTAFSSVALILGSSGGKSHHRRTKRWCRAGLRSGQSEMPCKSQ